MSLFTKGAWRRYHTEPEALQQCWTTLVANPLTLFALSALVGRANLILAGDTLDGTIGINPPDKPRLDCGTMVNQDDLDRYLLPHLAMNLKDKANLEPWYLPEGAEMPADVADVAEFGWAQTEREFLLFNRAAQVVGFWIVCWGRQDLVDKPSLREDRSASMCGMPYKLVSSEMKKELFGDDKDWDVLIARKQAPVILDLASGDLWLGNGGSKFAKALVIILSKGGLLLTPGELVLGNDKGWLRPALNLVRDKDLFKLERSEAVERMIQAERDGTADPVDDGEGAPPMDKQAQKQAAEDRVYLSELGCWAPDEGGEVLVLQAEASVALNPEAASSVATVSGRDALELFVSHPSAELVGCAGALTIPPPPMDDKGDLARITVDFTAELANGIYRNLEFTQVRSLWNELLEEPWVRDLGVASVVDSEISSRSHAPSYSRYWFRYYLMLRAFEQRLLHGFARVLDLDPTQVAVTSRSLFAKPEAPKDTAVAMAAAQTVNSLKANLREGESVSFIGGGRSTIIHGTASDDFLDDIPFAVD